MAYCKMAMKTIALASKPKQIAGYIKACNLPSFQSLANKLFILYKFSINLSPIRSIFFDILYPENRELFLECNNDTEKIIFMKEDVHY